MTPTHLHDHDLEARLRATLVERAGSIAGPPPSLDDAVLATLAFAPTPAPPSRHPRPIVRWVAVALVVSALGWTAATTTRSHPDRVPEAVRVDRPSEPSGPPVPELPPSLDLAISTPLATSTGSAVEVSRRYLAERLAYGNAPAVARGERPDGLIEGDAGDPATVDRLLGELDLTAVPSPVSGVTALAFDQDGPGVERLPTGRIFLRRDGDRWAVVAVATAGLALASVARSDGVLHTVVSADPHDPNLATGVTMSTAAVGSTLLGVVGSDGPGVETHEPVDEVPLVITARATRDRTVGLTEFVSDPPTRSAAIWSGSRDDAVGRRDPDSTARQLARSTAMPLEVVASEETTPPPGLAQAGVRLTLAGGLHVDVDLARTDTGWVVLGVRDDSGLSGREESAVAGEGPQAVRTFRHRVPATTTEAAFTYVSAGGWNTLPVEDLDATAGEATVGVPADVDVSATLLVGRDGSGTVVTVQGAVWD